MSLNLCPHRLEGSVPFRVRGTAQLHLLLGTPLDGKNIGLVKLLYTLRQDLDTYCLIAVNASNINENKASAGNFFGHVQHLAQERIALGMCKIYEEEKGYELNSISGVIKQLSKHADQLEALDPSKLSKFVNIHGGPVTENDPVLSLTVTLDRHRMKFESELERFKRFRDKIAAHSEYGIVIDTLPSYDAEEKLYVFGADFYSLVSSTFVGIVPVHLDSQRPIKSSLKRVLQSLGLESINDQMI